MSVTSFWISITCPSPGSRCHSPVRLLLLTVELAIGLLQLVCENLELSGEVVLCLELLVEKNQVPRGIVEGYVRQVQPQPVQIVQINHGWGAHEQQQVALGNLDHLALERNGCAGHAGNCLV